MVFNQKKWYQENRERLLKLQKKWRKKNKDKIKEINKRHREKHPNYQKNWLKKHPNYQNERYKEFIISKKLAERISDFFNNNSVMSSEDYDNILLEVENE